MDTITIVAKYFSNYRNPKGHTDKGGRWYPTEDEKCSCCDNIRSPTRAYPWSLWKHCKSIKHYKNLIAYSPSFLDKEIPEALKMTIENAPQYINTESDLFIYVRDELLGINKPSHIIHKEVKDEVKDLS